MEARGKKRKKRAGELAIVAVRGGGHFAVPLPGVERIVSAAGLTPLPSSTPGFVGLLSYEGTVLPVIDLCSAGEGYLSSRTGRFVIALGGLPERIGLIADRIGPIVIGNTSRRRGLFNAFEIRSPLTARVPILPPERLLKGLKRLRRR